MRYIFTDTFALLLFKLGELVLTIFPPLKWGLKVFYDRTLQYYEQPQRRQDFRTLISELQQLSVRQLKERIGPYILSCSFYLILSVYLLVFLLLDQKSSVYLRLGLLVFPALCLIFFFLCWRFCFFFLYTLLNKKDINSLDQVPLKPLTFYDWNLREWAEIRRSRANFLIPLIIILLFLYFFALTK